MSSLPPWKNVYKSGMWPDPNNNLLRACLPRHNAAESKVRLSNTAAFVLNLFLFSLNHFSAPTTTQSCRFFFPSLTLLSCLYHWHDIVMLFHSLSESKARKEFLSCQRSSVSLGKNETSTFWKNVTPILTRARRHESENEDPSSALYWQKKKGLTVDAVIIFFKECALSSGPSFFFPLKAVCRLHFSDAALLFITNVRSSGQLLCQLHSRCASLHVLFFPPPCFSSWRHHLIGWGA